MNSNTKAKVKHWTLAILAVMGILIATGVIGEVFAEKSPYDSGYDHGCDDAGISDPDDRYINQDGKGPSNHTNEFMDGYNAGYNSCSGGSSSNSDDNNNDNSNANSNANDNSNGVCVFCVR